MRLIRQPEGLGPPLGKYSHVSIDDRTGLVAVAGQVGVDGAGRAPGDGGFEAQVRQAFANIGHALAAVGIGFREVLKFDTYLISEDLIDPFMKARTEIFAEIYPSDEWPPNTLVVVHRLVESRFQVEIQALAVQFQSPGTS